MDNQNLPALPENFFADHPTNPRAPAGLTHELLGLEENRGFQAYLERAERKKADPEAEAEAARIQAMEDPAELVDYLRKCKKRENEAALRKKVLARQEETMPLLLRRFETTSQDMFIDIAVMTLAGAEDRYIQQLFREYDRIRDAYARSMACYLLGRRKVEAAAGLLLEEFEAFRRSHPREDYAQGPLLGLRLLYGAA